jgi:hypothetical protein
MIKLSHLDKFWKRYLWVRIFFLFFDVFVYRKMSPLGDTFRYLASTPRLDHSMLFGSTSMMEGLGGILHLITFGNLILANLPATLLAFFTIRWTAEKLKWRSLVGDRTLFLLLCFPNFCIWTSVFSKEVVGLVFSAILGVLYVNFLNGKFKIRRRDVLAVYLCLVFKPHYLPFIFQGLIFIYFAYKIKSPYGRFVLGLLFIAFDVSVLMSLSETINRLAAGMYIHFSSYGGKSTRPNIFLEDGDFFRHAPIGMIVAFVGPTFSEMLRSLPNLLAGLEGIFVLGAFGWLTYKEVLRLPMYGKMNPLLIFPIAFTTLGLLFIHYPFGIFNPGSGIRYRTNFVFLLMILFLYVYGYHKQRFMKRN